MLINEVDAIPQRNRHNLSDLKKRRGSTQVNAATKLYTLDAFRGRNAQYTQQNKENRRGNRKRRKGRGDERGKIENGFQLHLCMPMLPLEWMGMHNDNAIHHMRVGKQRNSSQIGNEQQREETLHYIPQLHQDFPIKQICEDNSIFTVKQPGLYIYLHLQSQIPTSCYSRKKTFALKISPYFRFSKKNIFSLQLYKGDDTSNQQRNKLKDHRL